MPDQSDADPVAALLGWLANHPEVTDALGGAGRVSGIPEAPWPHLSVADGPNGDLRGMVWSAEHEVELAVTSDPTGAPGEAALWRAAMKVLAVACRMPDEFDPTPGEPVVSRVRPSGTLAKTPVNQGQFAYVVGVMVVIRPPSL